MPGGRPSKFKPEFVDQARKLARLGATDDQIADFFEVGAATLYRWRHEHDEFREALKLGKDELDARVEHSLYHQAMGYEQDAVKIFMPAGVDEPVYAPYKERIAPSTTAAIFWLKNRQPARWRDRQELTGKDGGPIEIKSLAEQVAEREKRLEDGEDAEG